MHRYGEYNTRSSVFTHISVVRHKVGYGRYLASNEVSVAFLTAIKSYQANFTVIF